MNRLPVGWSREKLAALNDLLTTAAAVQTVAAVIAAVGDNTPAAAKIKADLITLAKSQLAALKAM